MLKSFVVTPQNGAITANGQSATFDMDNAINILVHVNVTAVAGTTPTLDIKLQTSPDGGTTWFDHPDITFTQMTAVAKQSKSLRGATGRLGRFDYVVGGSTPSFTTRIDVQCENPNNT